MERYPTDKNGIAISPYELELRSSHLDLSKVGNFNNHHNGWTAKQFGKTAILQVFRDLETNQFSMPCDVHEYLHIEYDPPKFPTDRQAIDEIERCKSIGYRLRIGSNKHPEYKEITDELMKRVYACYNSISK